MSVAVMLLPALPAAPASASTADRIGAVVERQVITVSEITQMVNIRFFPRRTAVPDDEYSHDVLDALIAQALRFRDFERFGLQDIPKDSIELRIQEIRSRFATPAAFDAAMQHAELTLDEVRALVKKQLQVEAAIHDRFAPVIVVSPEEIESYYKTTWSQQRRARGLPIPPLSQVSEEIRAMVQSSRLQEDVDTWTAKLRSNANVDVYAWR